VSRPTIAQRAHEAGQRLGRLVRSERRSAAAADDGNRDLCWARDGGIRSTGIAA
jgi:hypothetical protein